MIKVTGDHGEPIFLAIAHIVAVYRTAHPDYTGPDANRATVATTGAEFSVQETPEQVMALIRQVLIPQLVYDGDAL